MGIIQYSCDNMCSNIGFVKLLTYCCCVCLIASTAAQNSNYKYLGCFTGENLLTLGEESRSITPASPKSCSEFCIGKQYTFFVLKTDMCYCSKNYISRLMKQFDSDCTIKCSGDGSATCGGSKNDIVSSYLADTSKYGNFQKHGGYPIPIYLGCYSETPKDEGNRLLKGPTITQNNNTPKICSEMCFNMGYLYFGVTAGSQCWCGNQQPSKSSKVEEKNCNSPCSGDRRQFCGGGWKMGIYSTGITDYEPKKYIGCFADERKITGKYLSYQMGNNNSPRRCMNLCNTQQLKYATVKGNVCECKSYAPDYNLLRSQSECNTPCSENPSEYCGGGTTLQNVYSTVYSDPRGGIDISYVGCFKSSKRHPVLSGWKISLPQLTPQDCVQNCYAKRFPYAALVTSKECLCSSMKPYSGARTVDNMCSTPCAGDSRLKCGGVNDINVYSTGQELKTDTIGNYYMGCFEENQNNRIFTSFSKSFIPTNTPAYCSDLCLKNGYNYAGVTYMSECYCGNQPPDERLFSKLEDKQCNSKCMGDSNQFCGGAWRMGVFATGLNDLNVDSQYVGCFVHDNAIRKRKYELANTNTPSTCSAICYEATYLFAAVMGMDCLCSNDAPNSNQQLDDSACNSICTGDSSQSCGGNDKIQIFNLGGPNSMTNSGDVPITYPDPPSPVFSPTTTPEPPIYTPPLPLNINTPQPTVNKNKPPAYTGIYDFLNIDSYWSHEIYIPQEPDFEFSFYNNSADNVYVENNELIIKPTIIQNKEFITKGSLKLNGCTKNDSSGKCSHTARSFNIIPPVMSAKISTKNNSFFRYGEIEVEAKLPTGDWILTEFALVSKDNDRNKLVLMSKGNANLNCNGNDESTNTLKHGLQLDDQYHVNASLEVVTAPKSWSDDFHKFELFWRPGTVIFKIDGQGHTLNSPELLQVLFHSKNYLSLSVSVGGMKNFPDECLSNGHLKPWQNLNNKAMLNFWKDMDHWAPTWNDEISKLRVKNVKFRSLTV